MLIPLTEIIDKHLPEHEQVPIRGVIDIGSHKGESLTQYEAVETINRILWIEANPLVVPDLHKHTSSCKRPEIVHEYENELLSDTTGQKVQLVYPNDMSSEARMGLSATIAQHTIMTDKDALRITQNLATMTRLDMYTRRFDDLWREKKVYLDLTKYQMIRVNVGGDEPGVLEGFGKLFNLFSENIKYIYVSTYETLPHMTLQRSSIQTQEQLDASLIQQHGFRKVLAATKVPDKNGVIYGEAFYAR